MITHALERSVSYDVSHIFLHYSSFLKNEIPWVVENQSQVRQETSPFHIVSIMVADVLEAQEA